MDEDEGDYLGINLSGRQPKFYDVEAGIGHNSEVVIIGRVKSTIDSLVKLGEEHEEAFQTLVYKQEDEREAILLLLGSQLLEGRRLHEGDREFGKWCYVNFPNLTEHISAHEQMAILWAAEFPEERQLMIEKYPRVRTTRGLHIKWLGEKKKEGGKPPNKPSAGSAGGSSGTGSGNTGGSGNSTPPPPPQQDEESPSTDSNGINTTNPDKTSVLVDATMVASSLVGVVTNMLMFESTQGREVSHKELASAIFDEVRNQSVDQLTEDEIEDFIEKKLKRTLNLIMSSLPVLNGFETNVVKLTKKVENY
jgi:hypothetical protein